MIKDMVLELILGAMGAFIPVDSMATNAKARGKFPSFSEYGVTVTHCCGSTRLCNRIVHANHPSLRRTFFLACIPGLMVQGMKENSRRGNTPVKANTSLPMAVNTPGNGSRDNTMVR